MNAGRRTASGIIFLKTEINRLANTSTAIVDTPIPKPFDAEVVTASVGHIPNIKIKDGFSLMIPL
jgi:hypothetical protein